MELRPDQEDMLSKATDCKKVLSPPFLINISDGRLIPHVKNIAGLHEYRPYRGDPKASLEDRMRYVAANLSTRRVINSAAEEAEKEPVDIGKMEKTELIAFAFDEYGLALDPAMDVRTLRKNVMKAVESGAVKAAPTESDMSE